MLAPWCFCSGLPGSAAVWLTFDLTRAASFKQLEEGTTPCLLHVSLRLLHHECRLSRDNAEEWLRHIATKTGGGAVVMLVGNKADAVEQREVTAEEAKRWADQHGGLLYAEVSAKDSRSVEEALSACLRHHQLQQQGK
jgi:GTPase SAR1 family protein